MVCKSDPKADTMTGKKGCKGIYSVAQSRAVEGTRAGCSAGTGAHDGAGGCSGGGTGE